ncbi:hypothetical protein JCM11251_004920 [Rhodosporidiobolus azoricus]
MASLLDRALGGVQGQRGGAGAGGNRRQSGGGGGRNSPYERPADSWKHDKFGQEDDAPKPASSAGAAKGSLAARLGASPAAGRTNKLVIRNLHYEVSERELEVRRSKYISILPLVLIRRRPAHDPEQLAYSPFQRLPLSFPPLPPLPTLGKFDRSGRSEGIAWVSYGSEDHAQQAKEAFNGAPAKGQPIEVEYDTRPDRAAPGGGAAAPGSLLARLGGSDPSAPRSKYQPPSARPSRGGRSVSGTERGVGSAPRGGRGGAGGRRGRREGGRERKEPKTNEDLDRELEAFMKQPEGASAKPTEGAPPALAAPVASAPAPEAPAGGDVEMS